MNFLRWYWRNWEPVDTLLAIGLVIGGAVTLLLAYST
jgi:hypothetical protein